MACKYLLESMLVFLLCRHTLLVELTGIKSFIETNVKVTKFKVILKLFRFKVFSTRIYN